MYVCVEFFFLPFQYPYLLSVFPGDFWREKKGAKINVCKVQDGWTNAREFGNWYVVMNEDGKVVGRSANDKLRTF